METYGRMNQRLRRCSAPWLPSATRCPAFWPWRRERAGRKTATDILREKISLPCIAHVIVNDSLLHYVVIHKITKKHIIIADPAEGVMKIRIDEFIGKSETGNKYKWTGVCILFVKDHKLDKTFTKSNVLLSFFKLLIPQKRLLLHIF